MKKYSGEPKKFDRSRTSVIRMFALFLITITVFSLALSPPLLLLAAYFYFMKSFFLTIVFLPLILVLDFLVLVVSASFVTGGVIKIFHVAYDEGEYGKGITDNMTFKFSLYYTLYRPTDKLLKIFFIPPLYAKYLTLIGAKIGKHVFFGGRNNIADPCAVEIGPNTLIGGGASIFSHLGEEKLIIKKVKIGERCLIGAESLIMPGVVMEDNVVVGGKSLVTKNQVLKKGRMYGGVPAVEIKREKDE